MVRPAVIAAGVVLLVAPGCARLTALLTPAATTGSIRAAPAAPAGGSASTWPMPLKLSQVTAAAVMRGESTVLVWVPRTGYVKGTPDAIASLGRPLKAVPGRNRTVEACRTVVQSEASKLGARDVEAVSAGPEDHDNQGHIFGPVAMRITYDVPGGYEVRLATLTCVVNRKGAIVDAYS
jgi:hypothetical protein